MLLLNAPLIQVLKALAQDIASFVVISPDVYFGGTQLAALGRLAIIADNLGKTDLAACARAKLKDALEPCKSQTTLSASLNKVTPLK